MKIFSQGASEGRSAPECKFGTTLSETIRGRKLKFSTHLDRVKYSFRALNFFAKLRLSGAAPVIVNLGSLISQKLFALKS